MRPGGNKNLLACCGAWWLVFLCGLTITTTTMHVNAFIYPPADQTDWVPVDEYRRIHNISFEYRTKYINPEMCRYLTEEQCERQDLMSAGLLPEQQEQMERQRNARRRALEEHRRLDSREDVSQGRQRRLAKVNPLENNTFLSASTPSIATNVKVLVLLVQFTDHASRVLPSVDYFQELCDGTNSSRAINPVGSLKTYFETNSNGRYTIESCTVFDWRMTNNTEKFWAGGVSGLKDSAQAQQFFWPVLDAIDAEQSADDQFWLLPYDTSPAASDGDVNGNGGDGALDAVLVIHSGYAAELAATDCTGVSRQDRFWSQAHMGSSGEGWYNWDLNFQVSSFMIVSAFDTAVCDSPPNTMGVATHEWHHIFGSPELYSVAQNRNGGTGAYDVMSFPRGQANDGTRPGSTSTWMKLLMGWVECNEITEDGEYSISDLATTADCYLIRKKFADQEYLLIENRQKKLFDEYFFGSGGIVIYHVDDALGKTMQEKPGWPRGNNGYPQNHYRVSVVQADGRYDIENLVNLGDADDLYTEGMSLGPGGDNVYPNTDSYKGNATGITITVTTPSQDVMKFTVSGLSTVPNGTSPTAPSPTTAPATSPTTPSPTTAPAKPSLTASPTQAPAKQNTTGSAAVSAISFSVTTVTTAVVSLLAFVCSAI